MPMIVCVSCRKFFRPKKNGFIVEEGMPNGNKFIDEQSGWGAYKLWQADCLTCPDCATDIVAGFAPNPFAEHYMANYADWREQMPPNIFVPDCR